MRWLRSVWAQGRRTPWFGAFGLLGAASMAGMPVYLWFRHYRYIVTGETPFVWDFSYYYEAAARFAAHPLSLYADPEFFYPPPSVLLFLPWLAVPMPVAYLLSQLVIVATAVAGLLLALKTWEDAEAERLGSGMKTLLVLAGLGTAPVFQSLKYGQVGPLVMLVGAGAVLLLQRNRPAAAALAIASGFWLKLYPIFLVPLGLRARRSRFLVGLVIGFAVVPALLLFVLPLELYERYFFEELPARSGLTSSFAVNGSIAGVAARLGAPLAAFQFRGPAELGPVAQAVALAVTLLGIGSLVVLWLRQRLTTATAGVGLLALVPVVSPLGWEHLYTLALPLVLFALLAVRSGRGRARALVALGVATFFIPTLPEALMLASFEWWPRPVHDVIYARHLLATLCLLGVVVSWDVRQHASAPAAGPPGRS